MILWIVHECSRNSTRSLHYGWWEFKHLLPMLTLEIVSFIELFLFGLIRISRMDSSVFTNSRGLSSFLHHSSPEVPATSNSSKLSHQLTETTMFCFGSPSLHHNLENASKWNSGLLLGSASLSPFSQGLNHILALSIAQCLTTAVSCVLLSF